MPRNPLVQEMSMLSHDRNEELEEFMLGEYYFRRLLNEIVKRLKISFDTLTYLAPGEIVSCLRGGRLPNQKIRQRKRQFGFLIINDQIKEFYGTKAKVLQEDVILKTDIIKGVVAYSSKAKIKGRVKIIQTSDDIGKLKKGDILVAIMTTPNFIQAMNNAAAIVTDEGGITCHVAIISRELEKPCIIGTKIATRMLKDGDWVEVNTEKGIVRRLK
ncbi:hypothetical protein COV56_03570 [Candidatus Kuenenbacteria bacterium CG11_big_fil_rev_8_21_14_0_20_37_9]|nr:MAG: hypothetical protein COV56_03570 [Candidatus Kuenenbacteria bacterium CG11_big_fil_rev_8_21_14_0_20_37_9]